MPQRRKHPKSIGFIIIDEFFERFAFLGMRGILTLFMLEVLKFKQSDSIAIYHTFVALYSIFCLIGALFTNNFLGKFKTILILSVVYGIGSVLVTVGSIDNWDIPIIILSFSGLMLVSIGSGGIKPYVSGFGSDQYLTGNQKQSIRKFITCFYLTINLASILALILTPFLKNAFTCICMENCYPLAFGVSAIAMILALIVFAAGTRTYEKGLEPEEKITQIWRVISSALRNRSREKKIKPRENWLDYALKDHPLERVIETKALLKILLVFLPLPMFWGLFKQMGSTWVLQGRKMNGDLKFFTVTEEQMQAWNPLFLLILIPLSKFTIFPLLSLFRIRRPLQLMVTGMVFCGLAFVVAGLLERFINGKEDGCLHILWQIPQYFVLTLAEILFSVIGLRFALSETPVTLKHTIQNFWLITIALGNGIVALLEYLVIFENPEINFYFYAGLIFFFALILCIIAIFYKPVLLMDEISIQG